MLLDRYHDIGPFLVLSGSVVSGSSGEMGPIPLGPGPSKQGVPRVSCENSLLGLISACRPRAMSVTGEGGRGKGQERREPPPPLPTVAALRHSSGFRHKFHWIGNLKMGGSTVEAGGRPMVCGGGNAPPSLLNFRFPSRAPPQLGWGTQPPAGNPGAPFVAPRRVALVGVARGSSLG